MAVDTAPVAPDRRSFIKRLHDPGHRGHHPRRRRSRAPVLPRRRAGRSERQTPLSQKTVHPMIQVSPEIAIDDNELVERAVRASGPGGQHVNKTSSAIELRFSVRFSTLPDHVKERLESRTTLAGDIVIFAQEHRSQELNRQAARERLFDLIRQAAKRPKRRRPTKPTLASKVRRVEGKVRRSAIKARRGRVSDPD